MYKDEPQILTVVCKLTPTPEQERDFQNLSLIFAATCNYINASVNPEITSKHAIQQLIYADAKNRSEMQANHVIRAIARVAGNRKNSPVDEYKPGSVSYDSRTFSLSKDFSVASLSVLNKRVKVGLIVSDYHRCLIDISLKIDKMPMPSSAMLCKHSDGWYLHIQVKKLVRLKDAEIYKKNDYLGIDLGRKDIASLSNGQSFSGEAIEKVRTKYSKIRARLQHKASKGTRSSHQTLPTTSETASWL